MISAASARPLKPDQSYNMADYADDAAALMTAMGWDSAHVVGLSFGGMVAQELAIRHPDRIRRLVLGCTSPGGAGGASYPFHEIGHLTGEARARHLIPISDTRRDDAWARANPDQYAQFVAMGAPDPYADEPGHAAGALRQLEARAAHDAWDRLSQISCPTFIAAGRYDGIARPETQERMVTRIPGAKLQFFDGGHMFVIQDRDGLPGDDRVFEQPLTLRAADQGGDCLRKSERRRRIWPFSGRWDRGSVLAVVRRTKRGDL